jgi:hypothetical protein
VALAKRVSSVAVKPYNYTINLLLKMHMKMEGRRVHKVSPKIFSFPILGSI